MYPYPTVAASNPRSAYSRPETVSAMHPSPKSASRREFGTLRPRKGTLKVYNHVSFRNLFDFAKHRSPLPATSTPACPGRQKKFRTPYAAASSFPSHPLALFPKTRQQPVSPAATPAFGRFTDHQHRPDAPRLRHGAPRRRQLRKSTLRLRALRASANIPPMAAGSGMASTDAEKITLCRRPRLSSK